MNDKERMAQSECELEARQDERDKMIAEVERRITQVEAAWNKATPTQKNQFQFRLLELRELKKWLEAM